MRNTPTSINIDEHMGKSLHGLPLLSDYMFINNLLKMIIDNPLYLNLWWYNGDVEGQERH